MVADGRAAATRRRASRGRRRPRGRAPARGRLSRVRGRGRPVARRGAERELGLCLDTGHALYAGSDPASLARRYGRRVEHLHLKDVAEPVRARDLGFWEAIAAGLFSPVGDGLLDLDALRVALTAIGYEGFATVEQDRRPGTAGDPAADLRRSVTRLRDAGLG